VYLKAHSASAHENTIGCAPRGELGGLNPPANKDAQRRAQQVAALSFTLGGIGPREFA
jgi:hypothetical protein